MRSMCWFSLSLILIAILKSQRRILQHATDKRIQSNTIQLSNTKIMDNYFTFMLIKCEQAFRKPYSLPEHHTHSHTHTHHKTFCGFAKCAVLKLVETLLSDIKFLLENIIMWFYWDYSTCPIFVISAYHKTCCFQIFTKFNAARTTKKKT